MTSKERVRTALARQEPDRVPVNYFANPGIDGRLKNHYGLASDDHDGLCRALGVDFRNVMPVYTGAPLHAEVPGRQVNTWGMRQRWVEHGTGGYWDYCDFPLREASADEVAAWPMPSPDDHDYDALVQACDRHGAYGVVLGGSGIGDIMNKAGMIFGVDETLMQLASGAEPVRIWTDRRLATMLEVMRRSLEAARGKIDLLWMGEDLGTQIAPIISLDMFRRDIRPRLQPYVDLARAFEIPAMIHCCGSSSWAFDDFIEMGITVVDTLQPEAAHMAPAHLKHTFGDRLAFHGCISTAGPVAAGTVEDVTRTVRETLAVMMPGGGYALAPTHLLQDNSPTENVVAMYEAGQHYGRYG